MSLLLEELQKLVIAVLIVMCYNLVVVRDLLSWLWKLGECDVSPLRVSEALNIILTYTGTYC